MPISLKPKTPPPALPRPASPPPSDLTGEFARLATSLSDRIVALEKYLASRPATMRAQVQFESQERSHQLEWMRINGAWQLWVWDVQTEEELEDHLDEAGNPAAGINGRPLRQCAVDVKLSAAEAIPSLLENIRQGERKTIERLKAAHATLDKLAIEWPEGT